MKPKKLFYQVVFILAFSSILGIVANFPLIEKYFKGEYRYSFLSLEKYSSITFITLAEAEELFARREALFIDSRSKEDFRASHIMEAKNIPFETHKERKDLNVPSLPLEGTLVVYCDGSECQSSVELAKRLHKMDFKDIRIFFSGWAEWVRKGLPISLENDKK